MIKKFKEFMECLFLKENADVRSSLYFFIGLIILSIPVGINYPVIGTSIFGIGVMVYSFVHYLRDC